MLPALLCLSPPFLNAATVAYTHGHPRERPLKAVNLAAIIAIALHGILHPPWTNALVNYASGFILSWYCIWSVNVLFVYDINSLRRLQVINTQGRDDCYWVPLHTTTGLSRLVWTLDLSTNFRGLGWRSTKTGVFWPRSRYNRSSFTSYEASRRPHELIRHCVVFGLSRQLGHQCSNFLILNMLATACALYSFIDGVHVTVSVVAVHILGPKILGTWGRSELYPQLFGRASDMGLVNLKGLWGRTWHDMLKGGLLSLTESVVLYAPVRPAARRLIQSTLCFVLSALVHAAASYSVSRNVAASCWVFIGFSSQIIGIVAQQGSVSALSKTKYILNEQSWRILSRIMEIGVGFGWIILSFPLFCEDPALQNAIRWIGGVRC